MKYRATGCPKNAPLFQPIPITWRHFVGNMEAFFCIFYTILQSTSHLERFCDYFLKYFIRVECRQVPQNYNWFLNNNFARGQTSFNIFNIWQFDLPGVHIIIKTHLCYFISFVHRLWNLLKINMETFFDHPVFQALFST